MGGCCSSQSLPAQSLPTVKQPPAPERLLIASKNLPPEVPSCDSPVHDSEEKHADSIEEISSDIHTEVESSGKQYNLVGSVEVTQSSGSAPALAPTLAPAFAPAPAFASAPAAVPEPVIVSTPTNVQKLIGKFGGSFGEASSLAPAPMRPPMDDARREKIEKLRTQKTAGGGGVPRTRADIVFDKYDWDGDKLLDAKEFQALCKDNGLDISLKHAEDAVLRLDTNGDKKLSLEEFKVWWRLGDKRFEWLLLAENQRKDLYDALDRFYEHDKNEDGLLSEDEFRGLHSKLEADRYDVRRFEDDFADLDMDKSGRASVNEYVNWIIRRNFPNAMSLAGKGL